MLLGVAGFASDWRGITAGVLEQASGLGFSALQVRVPDPVEVRDKEIERIKGLFAAAGMAVGQTVGHYGGALSSPDQNARAAAIKFVKRMCNLTGKLGAPNTYLRPGSLNSRGAWLPHRDNRSDEVFARLVDSAVQICRVAENEGVTVAVEAGVVSPLYSPARTRAFFDAVDSKSLAFNMDPVNVVGSLDDAFDTAGMMARWFDALGHVTVGGHAKDFRLVEGLLPSFEEVPIGQGMLDHAAFLKGVQAAAPRGHVLIEHLMDEDIPAAADALRDVAGKAGIRWGGV